MQHLDAAGAGDVHDDAMVRLNVPPECRAVEQFVRNFSPGRRHDVVETLRQSEARISAAG